MNKKQKRVIAILNGKHSINPGDKDYQEVYELCASLSESEWNEAMEVFRANLREQLIGNEEAWAKMRKHIGT